jgi:hypothetical protein
MNNERITQIKPCGCERGCEHMFVSVTEDIMVHKSDLSEFLREYDYPRKSTPSKSTGRF